MAFCAVPEILENVTEFFMQLARNIGVLMGPQYNIC